MNIIDKLASKEDMVSPGISACGGCNVELTLRTCLKVLGPDTIVAVPPGCMGGVGVVGWDSESGTKIPVFFPLLDNVASMLAGIKMHYEKVGRKVNVVAFAGDGATTDAGLQCLSGAAERGDKIIYICYDNEGYMNTGYQRSSATSKYSWTSTTPVARDGHGGKKQHKKDFPLIMMMHDIPYMATCSPAFIPDMVKKVEKAMEASERGLAYLHVYNPCLTGWGIPAECSIEKARQAVESNFFPLYEVEDGKITISKEYKTPLPVAEFISGMKKFRHIESEQIQELQDLVNHRWDRLKQLAVMKQD